MVDKYLSFLVALKCNIHPVPWSPQQDRGSAASNHKLSLCWLPPLPSYRGSYPPLLSSRVHCHHRLRVDAGKN